MAHTGQQWRVELEFWALGSKGCQSELIAPAVERDRLVNQSNQADDHLSDSLILPQDTGPGLSGNGNHNQGQQSGLGVVLSAREQCVMKHISRGSSNEEIAEALRRTPGVKARDVWLTDDPDGFSRLYYGKYYRRTNPATGRRPMPPKMREDLELIRRLAAGPGKYLFVRAMVLAMSGSISLRRFGVRGFVGLCPQRAALRAVAIPRSFRWRISICTSPAIYTP